MGQVALSPRKIAHIGINGSTAIGNPGLLEETGLRRRLKCVSRTSAPSKSNHRHSQLPLKPVDR